MAMATDSSTIPLGLYLWKRINQVGVKTVMGVPGDFNLQLLDYIYQIEGMTFVGNTNELNASYAADGYARVNGGPGALITTHGVGELSALNGVAGAASERIPVIHVVGQTAQKFQEKQLMIHHSIGTRPDHQLFNKVSKHIRADAAELWDADKAPAEIDRVIRECVIQSSPVYIFMPLNLHDRQVPASLLDKQIDLTFPVNHVNEKAAVEAISQALEQAKKPVIFLDMLAQRFATKEVKQLVDTIRLPFFASHGAKGLVDEDHERFVGLYNGVASEDGVVDAIEGSDEVLAVGWWPADTNGGLFRNIPEKQRIDVMDDHVIVNGKRFEQVYMAPLLQKLIETLPKADIPQVPMPQLPSMPNGISEKGEADKMVDHNHMWPRFGKFVQPGDVVVCDTGAPQYGIPDAVFPKDVLFFTQVYYGSIGYGCPAAGGADFARRERPGDKGRTVLITGDGGLMLTIQEVALMIAEGLKPIIIIINNNGYTVERAIHGARQKYNDIPVFKYAHMLSFFGGESKPGVNFHLVKNQRDLDSALTNPHVVKPTEVQIIEVLFDAFDIPWRLAGLLKARGGDVLTKELIQEGFTNVQ